MKIKNKLKAISIAACCLVASLWSETQCMQNIDITTIEGQNLIQQKLNKMQEILSTNEKFSDFPYLTARSNDHIRGTEGILSVLFVNKQYNICHTSRIGWEKLKSEVEIGKFRVKIPTDIGYMKFNFSTYEEIENNKELIETINVMIRNGEINLDITY